MSRSSPPTPTRPWARPPFALIGLAAAGIVVGSAKAADGAPSASTDSPSVTDLASLAGTWSVTGTSDPADGCASVTLAYQGILSVQHDGTASVTALGATGFPALEGDVELTSSGFSASFDGFKDAGLTSGGQPLNLKERSTFRITGSRTNFTGSRTWSGYTVTTDGSALPLVCRWSISGKHL